MHDPRTTWRNTWGRRLVLLLGWAAAFAAVGGLVVAARIGALWAWGISPAAAGFAAFTMVVMPEPVPAAPIKPLPKYLLGDQRLNLLAPVSVPEAAPQVISSLRASRRLAVPQRQAA